MDGLALSLPWGKASKGDGGLSLCPGFDQDRGQDKGNGRPLARPYVIGKRKG